MESTYNCHISERGPGTRLYYVRETLALSDIVPGQCCKYYSGSLSAPDAKVKVMQAALAIVSSSTQEVTVRQSPI